MISLMRTDMGERLKTLRKARKLTQIEVAVATGIDRAYLSKLENGNVGTSIETLEALSDFYKVSIDFIYRGIDYNNSRPDEASYALYTREEVAMINLWRTMDEGQQRLLMTLLGNAIRAGVA